MTRIGKKQERKARSPRKHKKPSRSTGPLKDNLPEGFKPVHNAAEGDLAQSVFIGKVR